MGHGSGTAEASRALNSSSDGNRPAFIGGFCHPPRAATSRLGRLQQQGARCRAGPPLAPTDWPPGCSPEPSPGWQGIAAEFPHVPQLLFLTAVTRKGDAPRDPAALPAPISMCPSFEGTSPRPRRFRRSHASSRAEQSGWAAGLAWRRTAWRPSRLLRVRGGNHHPTRPPRWCSEHKASVRFNRDAAAASAWGSAPPARGPHDGHPPRSCCHSAASSTRRPGGRGARANTSSLNSRSRNRSGVQLAAGPFRGIVLGQLEDDGGGPR